MAYSDDSYFNSYGDFKIHELMLNDDVRTNSYENFITKHKYIFENKIILDVGSGTGIISLFAARAGAKKVYAVEANEQVCKLSSEIFECNGYSNKIILINDCVENINIEKVDVIISEWMGFYLLHESMLCSVINARDRFLKPLGIIVPAFAELYICPTSIETSFKDHLHNWKLFHGFDFSPMGKRLFSIGSKNEGIKIMKIFDVDLISEPKLFLSFDLKFVDIADLDRITASFQFTANKYSVLRGYAFWFQVNFFENSEDFEQTNKIVIKSANHLSTMHKTTEQSYDITFNQLGKILVLDNDCILNTSPSFPDTHWHQTIVFLPDMFFISKNQTLNCTVELIREKLFLQQIGNAQLQASTVNDLNNIKDDNDMVSYGVDKKLRKISNDTIKQNNLSNVNTIKNKCVMDQRNHLNELISSTDNECLTNISKDKLNILIDEAATNHNEKVAPLNELDMMRRYRIIIEIPDDDEDEDNDEINDDNCEENDYDKNMRQEIENTMNVLN